MPISEIPVFSTPEIDLAAIQKEDAVFDQEPGIPFRFGIEHPVDLNLKNSGIWIDLPEGGRLWRLGIHAPRALSINLVYEDFYIPEGGRFFLYDKNMNQILGAFTPRNNKADRGFATALINDEVTYLEYYEPAAVAGLGRIGINTVVHGYRDIKSNNDLGSSGACNIDVICAEGDNWRDEIRAVGKTIAGGGLCSGTLVGNTTGDNRPLFLTADHCGFSSTVVIYWLFERPACGSGTPDDTKTTTGATLLADVDGPNVSGIDGSDHLLMQLTENPADAYNVYYAGWDANGATPQAVTGIHHPAGDAKKISMENDPLTSTGYASSTADPSATHWQIGDWDSGTTEGGSSGSGLFDNTTKRLVGMLSGGGAACGNNNSDWYGKFSYAWLNNDAAANKRLKDWLDPGNTGILAIDGYQPGGGNTSGTCANPIDLACGSNVNGNTVNGVNNYISYNGDASYTGPELFYGFQTNGGQTTIQLSGYNQDLDLFLVTDCNNPDGSRVASSTTTDPTENINTNLAAGTYYVLIDGYNGAQSAFNLALTCAVSSGTCAAPINLSCGDNVNGNTGDGENNYTSYGGDASYTGPELFYQFQTNGGQTTIQLSGYNQDLDLFLVTDCNDPDGSSVASSITTDPTETITTNLAAGTYYILIDGYNGAVSTFNLSLTCGSGGGDCSLDPLAVNDNPIPSDTYKAAQTLTSTGRVASGSTVIFEAGQSITLSPGFIAENGSTFTARIQACAVPPEARIVLEEPETKSIAGRSEVRVYPNPFRGETTVELNLPEEGRVSIALLDMTGRQVAEVLPYSFQAEGIHQFRLSNHDLGAGIYLLMVRMTDGIQTKRVSIIN